jgi:hypothetical protein
MLTLVPEAEKQQVDKDKLTDLEIKILSALNFNFQIAGPCQCIERYLRILNYDKTSSKII